MALEELTALMAAPIYAAYCTRYLPQDDVHREQLMRDAVRDARAIYVVIRKPAQHPAYVNA